MIQFDASGLDSASLRSAGKELLSLALIDARNHTLRWASALEAAAQGRALALAGDLSPALAAELDPALWTLGHIGWFQEYWIARNVQRGRGERADPSHPRLASIVPEADAWYDAATVDRARRRALAGGALPDLPATRAYLVETLETTLELLAGIAIEDDASLYFHRLALFHEEMHAEAFAALAQTLGIDTAWSAESRPGRRDRRSSFRRRAGCSAPAAPAFASTTKPSRIRSTCRSSRSTPAVTWAQFGEFVEDGGYDERIHWNGDGWEWLQKEGRRTPRHVDQMRQGVLQRRFGVLARPPVRIPPSTSAGTRPMHGAAGPVAGCRAKSSGKRQRIRARRGAFAGVTFASGRRRRFGPIPALSPDRGATARCPHSDRTRCCAAPRSRPGRAS